MLPIVCTCLLIIDYMSIAENWQLSFQLMCQQSVYTWTARQIFNGFILSEHVMDIHWMEVQTYHSCMESHTEVIHVSWARCDFFIVNQLSFSIVGWVISPFYDFCSIWSMAVNKYINCSFYHLYLLFTIRYSTFLALRLGGQLCIITLKFCWNRSKWF